MPLAFVPSLLADINTAPAGFRVTGSGLAELNGQAYFFGSVGVGATSLWKTDGTTAGTTSVVNVSGTDLLQAGDRLYFFAHADELWTSDGTTGGTYLVKELQPGEGRSFPRNLTAVGDLVFFTADDGTNGRELWRTDGTPEGTRMVSDLASGPASSTPDALTDVNGTVFFHATDGIHGRELWKSDGTEQGTVLVKDIRPGSASSMITVTTSPIVDFNGEAFFIANDGSQGLELWKSDGTEAGTTLVKEIRPGTQGSDILNLLPVGNVMYFGANDGANGHELWKTDGTEAGTNIVSDIGNGHITHIIAFPDGRIIFSGSVTATNQYQIWVSDGTPDDTHLLNANVRDPQRFTALGSVIYFSSHGDDFRTTGLWQTDGTELGTKLVKSILVSPNRLPSALFSLTAIAGKIYFSATHDEINGSQLWVSDGTLTGTQLILRGEGQTLSSLVLSIPSLTIGSIRYFVAYTETLGRELWRTDGTPEGTFLLRDIVTGPHSSYPKSLTNVNGRLYFTAVDENEITRLWTTDGTSAGTLPVALEAVTASILSLKNVNGAIFFTTQKALWKTDGTPEGTILLKSFNNVFQHEGPSDLTVVGTALFFSANASGGGFELWKSDGTPGGTTLVKTFSGPENNPPRNFVNLQETLFFAADDGIHGKELWKSDGTEAGTVMVKDLLAGESGSDPWYFTVAGDKLFFRTLESSSWRLWVTEGTSESTLPLANFTHNNFGHWQVIANGYLVFNAESPSSGSELWRSDGTVAGTVQMLDIRPGIDSSYPSSLININGLVFFNASNSDGTQSEMWLTDGTVSGTRLYTEAPTGLAASDYLFALGERFIFRAYDEAYGSEFWSARFINVAPAFEKGSNIDTTDEDGPFLREGWATSIVAGPADESPQTVEFVVETSNPDIFVEPPAIDATGRLTFTPKPNASGTATITARLRDNGGTLFGGSNTSAAATFEVNVTKPHPLHNVINGLDVNLDNSILAADALAVINYINAFGFGPVPDNVLSGVPYLDVVADNQILAGDALAVINHLNAFGPTIGVSEGEPANSLPPPSNTSLSADLLALLATDMLEATRYRRR